jgi:hypothetical protein
MAKFPGFHKIHPPPAHHQVEGERYEMPMNKGFFRWRGRSPILGKFHKKPRMALALQSPMGMGVLTPITTEKKEVGRCQESPCHQNGGRRFSRTGHSIPISWSLLSTLGTRRSSSLNSLGKGACAPFSPQKKEVTIVKTLFEEVVEALQSGKREKSARKGLEIITGKSVKLIEQNPEKPSVWAELKRKGHKVYQIVNHDGKYLGVVVYSYSGISWGGFVRFLETPVGIVQGEKILPLLGKVTL